MTQSIPTSATGSTPKSVARAANSPAARDIACAVHPSTHLRRHLDTGPLVIVGGEGVRGFAVLRTTR